jgi:uncharacterized cysteine cluster protein YcgN (CxxCxxCC family)
LVKHTHASEAIALCKNVKVDSLQYTTYEAANKIFDDIVSLQMKKIDHIPWKPYMTANNYKEAYSNENDNNYPATSKRIRTDNAIKDNNGKQLSYKEIAANHNDRNHLTSSTQSNPTNRANAPQSDKKYDLL